MYLPTPLHGQDVTQGLEVVCLKLVNSKLGQNAILVLGRGQRYS